MKFHRVTSLSLKHLFGALMFHLLILNSPAMAAHVYECNVEGKRVFSDQPCGTDARQREIGTSNRMEAQDTSILQRHEPAPKRPSTAAADDDTERRREACNRLREQKEEIRTRMRLGYTAAQGIRLEERLRKNDRKYREQRCERYQ